jgi:hypothetical protein
MLNKIYEFQRMQEEFNNSISSLIGVSPFLFSFLIAVISIWALSWKGFALWKASKKNHIAWFVFLLVINTFGILEILYIFWLSNLVGKIGSSKIIKKFIRKK